MLSHAMEINAPAEAALLLTNTNVRIGAFSSAVLILSAASNSPPKVLSSKNRQSALASFAASTAFSVFRWAGFAILSSIL